MKAFETVTVREIEPGTVGTVREIPTSGTLRPWSIIRPVDQAEKIAAHMVAEGISYAGRDIRADDVRGIVTDDAREFFDGWEEIGTSDVSAGVRSAMRSLGLPDDTPEGIIWAVRFLVQEGIRGI